MNDKKPRAKIVYPGRLISLSDLFNPKSRPKLILTGASTNKTSNMNTANQFTPRSYRSYCSTPLSPSNSLRSIKNRSLNSISPISHKTIKHRNNSKTHVAFMKCVPKSNSCKFTRSLTGIPSSPKEYNKIAELPSNALKLFSEVMPRDRLEQMILSRKKKVTKPTKVFSMISSKRAVGNFLPNENIKKQITERESPELILQKAYKPLFKHQKKINGKHLSAIIRDLSTNMPYFSIVHSKQFSERYRPFSGDLSETKDEKERLRKLQSPSIKMPLQKSLNKMIKAKRASLLIQHNQTILDKYKKIMIRAAIHFKRLNMKLKDFYQTPSDHISYYSHEETKLLMNAIKEGDLIVIAELIKHNSFLVHDFDDFKQTPLHWAAKRNFYPIIPLMISKGAFIDARDSIGNTPLHYASHLHNLESIQLLLYAIANPNIKNNKTLTPFDYSASRTVQFILARYEKLYKVHKLGNSKEFESRLKIGLDYLFKDELRLSIDLKVYQNEET